MSFLLKYFAVSKEHGALELFELGGGRVHAADAVLRGAAEDGVPGPRDLAAVHEALRQDRRQGEYFALTPLWLSGGAKRPKKCGKIEKLSTYST